jgi:4-diphosphocytidyl-2-C-methyl-D-erythritol kinase
VRAIRIHAPAKVNLRLKVMAREADGYHQLETIFQGLEFGDDVAVRPVGDGVHIEVDGPVPCADVENLAYRAAEAFRRRAGISQGVAIRLAKRIPAGGGLGGGSSDAAAVLKALNVLFEGELEVAELDRMAADLGADVPYFLSPSPLALAWGRGDRCLPVPALPSAPVLLCLPDVEVHTPAAFAELARARETEPTPAPAGVLDPKALTTWQGIAGLAVNDFEPVVFEMHPVLGTLHAAMVATGPVVCLLAGSGGAVFAVYDGTAGRDAALAVLSSRFPGQRFVATSTLASAPSPLTSAD